MFHFLRNQELCIFNTLDSNPPTKIVLPKFPAFTRPNVRLVEDPIVEFTEKGLLTKSGEEHQADVIILATGFNMLHCLFPIHGADRDKSMGDIFGDEPRTYLGMVHPNLPNMFYVEGPGSGLGHSSMIYVTECQVGALI